MNTDVKKDRMTPVLATTLLVVVNLVAIYGQAHFFHDKTHDWVSATFISAAIELIGVYLAHMTHKFLMDNQSPGLARPGAYVVGLVAAVLNFLHWGGVMGVTFAVLSALSPFLWSVWTRYRHRQRLAELGMVDARSPRFSISRKLAHPIKTFKVWRFAAWEGIDVAEEAVSAWEEAVPVSPAVPAPVSEPASDPETGNDDRKAEIPLTDVDAALADLDRKAKIVMRAREIKAEGGSWEAAAKMLNVSGRTLRNYRKEFGDAD